MLIKITFIETDLKGKWLIFYSIYHQIFSWSYSKNLKIVCDERLMDWDIVYLFIYCFVTNIQKKINFVQQVDKK